MRKNWKLVSWTETREKHSVNGENSFGHERSMLDVKCAHNSFCIAQAPPNKFCFFFFVYLFLICNSYITIQNFKIGICGIILDRRKFTAAFRQRFYMILWMIYILTSLTIPHLFSLLFIVIIIVLSRVFFFFSFFIFELDAKVIMAIR